jgi:hypothetical protein
LSDIRSTTDTTGKRRDSVKRNLVLLVVAASLVVLLVPSAGADETYEFGAPVFDIDAAPDGSILVGVNDGGTREIHAINDGEVSKVMDFESATDLQGVSAIGTSNAFMTTAGSDLARDGELYRGSRGVARMVADLGAFEVANDIDAFSGPRWKDQACEEIDGFSAGPQNNPYHVTALTGGTALVADAAGNTVLRANTNGNIDWLALFTPPVDGEEDYMIRWFAGDTEEIPCYVQPVPTAVAIAPDGDLYVGELTGTTAEGFPIGLSRIWRIHAGASHVVCSERSEHATDGCELFADGFTSIIDVAFGPDGRLYVVEYDEASWLGAVLGFPEGGTISACDASATCVVVAENLSLPSAITFDKRGGMWLLESNIISPTVRRVELD